MLEYEENKTFPHPVSSRGLKLINLTFNINININICLYAKNPKSEEEILTMCSILSGFVHFHNYLR